MIYSIVLFIVNIVTSFFLSKHDNFFKVKKDQLTGEFVNFFSSKPISYESKYNLRQNNKYNVEIGLFIFVIIGFIIINAALSYFLVKIVSENENEIIENLFKAFFVEFIIIIATGLIINKFKESLSNFKKIKLGDFFYAFLDAEKIYFPFVTLEGAIASEMAKSSETFLALPFTEIKELIIEPSRRVVTSRGYAYTPPYYKILLNEKEIPTYVMRSYFFGNEKDFISKIAANRNLKIIYNDQLN